VGEVDPWDYGFNQSKCRSLPCVFVIHTAKPPFCRVYFSGTQQIKRGCDGSVKCDQRDHMSHCFAVCNSLPCVFLLLYRVQFFTVCFFVSLPCLKSLPCVFFVITVLFSLPCAFSQTHTAKSFSLCSAVFNTRQRWTNTAKNIFPVVIFYIMENFSCQIFLWDRANFSSKFT
jgi:hypothetical protein